MASFDFPSTPSNGQSYTANGITYTFDGTAWKRNTGAVKGQKGEEGTAATKGQKGEVGTGVKGQKGEVRKVRKDKMVVTDLKVKKVLLDLMVQRQ